MPRLFEAISYYEGSMHVEEEEHKAARRELLWLVEQAVKSRMNTRSWELEAKKATSKMVVVGNELRYYDEHGKLFATDRITHGG